MLLPGCNGRFFTDVFTENESGGASFCLCFPLLLRDNEVGRV